MMTSREYVWGERRNQAGQLHIFPIEDDVVHELSAFCVCMPQLGHSDGERVVVHSALNKGFG